MKTSRRVWGDETKRNGSEKVPGRMGGPRAGLGLLPRTEKLSGSADGNRDAGALGNVTPSKVDKQEATLRPATVGSQTVRDKNTRTAAWGPAGIGRRGVPPAAQGK